mgnify:CR=1 FL=1
MTRVGRHHEEFTFHFDLCKRRDQLRGNVKIRSGNASDRQSLRAISRLGSSHAAPGVGTHDRPHATSNPIVRFNFIGRYEMQKPSRDKRDVDALRFAGPFIAVNTGLQEAAFLA